MYETHKIPYTKLYAKYAKHRHHVETTFLSLARGISRGKLKKKTEKAQKASQVVYIDKTLFNKAGRVCVFQAVAENVLHGLRRRVKKFFRGKV